MKFGTKAIAIALLFIGLVLLNFLAIHLPFRADVTADHIYTLSGGTRSLLSKVEEPVSIDFYFSRSSSSIPIEVKDYADRVEEMLGQYVRAAHGKITLRVVDPEPDTPQEEAATKSGVQAQRIRAGAEPFYFGVVITQADKQKAIAALTPDREQFLEYDLSELVYSIQQLDKKKLGLITSLPLQGTPANPMTQQPGGEGQYVVTEWQDTFDIVPVEATATELPAHLDALAVVHPENLTPKLQFAIDQFLLAGKPVFLAVDPSSLYFKHQGGQMAMFQGPQPNVSSDLPVLFGGWGIAYNSQKVVGDNQLATQLQTQNGGVARDPVWLSLTQPNFNAKSLPTAQLNSMMVVESGSIALAPGSNLTLTPLLETTPKAGTLDSAGLQFAQPDDIARQIKSSGKQTIAALITGKFKSAFPSGAPKDEPAPDADKKDAPKPAAAPAPATPALKESSGVSTLLLVADTDWLLDDYSIRKFQMLGQTAAEPLNDNLSFAANSVDFLSGSQDLISIRGKGSSLRPFLVVKRMETEASEQYEEQLGALEAQLTAVEGKLTELQGKKSEGGRLVATPEVAKAIKDFQSQQANLRGQRRQISLALRRGINALEHRLLLINLFTAPLLLCAFGLWYHRRRQS
jgi:ABC-type uncharacterized transport system involved in gliding motility auxiliary subunit